MIRSLMGVVAGVAVMVVLCAMGVSVVLHGGERAGMPLMLELLLLAMRGLAAVAGGYLAARIAGRRPVANALTAAVGFLLVVQFAPPEFGVLAWHLAAQPFWLSALAAVATLVGGVLGGAAHGPRQYGIAP